MSRDFTGGYGPVEYVVKRAQLGVYSFSGRLYSPIVNSFGYKKKKKIEGKKKFFL
jgi:hypothetical protein